MERDNLRLHVADFTIRMSASMLSRLIQIPVTAGKENYMYITDDINVNVLAILFAKRIMEDSALYVFIGSNENDQENPSVYLGVVRRTNDDFLMVEAYSSMDLKEFLTTEEALIFSSDYFTSWIEKKSDRLYEISIMEASNVFDGEECHVDIFDISLPNNFFGVCPF